jgi:uncharacterized protein
VEHEPEFEVYRDTAKPNEFRWRLKSSGNHKIIASGEGYEAKSSAMNGIKAVQRDAPVAKINDLT